jgi:zinc transport system ATP-binding protein
MSDPAGRESGEPPAQSDIVAVGRSILVVAGLSVRRREHTILSDVSLEVARGDIHLIVGPNGAGKTTLLLAVLGQTAFTGRILGDWKRGGTIGYVPQSFTVDRTLPITVEDFLGLTRQRRPVCFGLGRATKAQVFELLERAGIPGTANQLLSVLSGGELRRLLLAHALDPLPELLILDEPAAGLDQAASRALEETLLAVCRQQGVTVLMVSHDLEQARRIADHVTVLNRIVIADGAAESALAGFPQ